MRTAEFVTPKHPDKLCDQISDAVLDECLRQDPDSRVAIEAMGGHGIVTVTGELTTKAFIDVNQIVHEIVGKDVGVQVNIVKQSPDIAKGVDIGGAGDQGIMRGYAVRETENFMPREYEYARELCRYLYNLFPVDGKVQITMGENPMEIDTVVASFANTEEDALREAVVDFFENHTAIYKVQTTHVNPAGHWSRSGFDADTGLTGRKLLIDNYGPRFPIGGGAFSGKDATKVDRSAAYMARKVAVETLKTNKQAQMVEVELAYAIGVEQPVSALIAIHDSTGVFEIDARKKFDLTPKGIIELLRLEEPGFQEAAEWGHFGRGFAWE